ncbi:hypothetical protein FACS1894169_06400 [Bacteroidia bacterium]|nr:hypothetical protein FACS1894169_06400 [Bacteroidia bacterium]
MNKKERYDAWVDRVCDFIEEVGPRLGKCASAFQSKPILEKQVDALFLGYNAHEDYPFAGVNRERFYEGNPFFYKEQYTKKWNNDWKVWSKPYGMFKWADYLNPMTDGNFIFMNAIYFGSKDMKQFNTIPGSKEATQKCLDLTGEVIQEVFKPKCIVCFSIKQCFDPLNNKYKFTDVKEQTFKIYNSEKDAKYGVKKGMWNNIPVYGMIHPSMRISNDDLGAIVLYLQKEMQQLGI